jgi:hypothetical protein
MTSPFEVDFYQLKNHPKKNSDDAYAYIGQNTLEVLV